MHVEEIIKITRSPAIDGARYSFFNLSEPNLKNTTFEDNRPGVNFIKTSTPAFSKPGWKRLKTVLTFKTLFFGDKY